MDDFSTRNGNRGDQGNGKSFVDLTKALNSFQTSVGNIMHNEPARMTFKTRRRFYAENYSIKVPDGFGFVTKAKDSTGTIRDIIMWKKDPDEAPGYVLPEGNESKAIVVVCLGYEALEKEPENCFAQFADEMVPGDKNDIRTPAYDYAHIPLSGGFKQRRTDEMLSDFFGLAGVRGKMLKVRVIFNGKYNVDDMNEAVNDLMDTIRLEGVKIKGEYDDDQDVDVSTEIVEAPAENKPAVSDNKAAAQEKPVTATTEKKEENSPVSEPVKPVRESTSDVEKRVVENLGMGSFFDKISKLAEATKEPEKPAEETVKPAEDKVTSGADAAGEEVKSAVESVKEEVKTVFSPLSDSVQKKNEDNFVFADITFGDKKEVKKEHPAIENQGEKDICWNRSKRRYDSQYGMCRI